MRYRSILVHVARTEAHDAAIGFAASLAADQDALLIGLSAGMPAIPPIADGMSAAIVAEMMENERTQLADAQRDAERRFRSLATAAPRTEWRAIEASVAGAIAAESRAADLIVLPRVPADSEPDMLQPADPGDVLMAAGRPVLLPGTGVTGLPRAPAIVAWKEALEPRRALGDALPLLKRATQVVVLGVNDGDEELDRMRAQLDDVVAHLARHEVAATARLSALAPSGPSEEILSVANEIGAGLIVAGGFGHSRVHEWIFGGVTRTLLKPQTITCLLSR